MDVQPTFDYEEETDKARWYRNDLDSDTGWTKRSDVPDEFMFWTEAFPDKKCPIVCLYKFLNMPIPYEKCAEVMGSSDLELRKKWDKAFEGIDPIAKYTDGALTYHVADKMPWPITDRDWILHRGAFIEIDWFGQRALMMTTKDASDTSTFVPPAETKYVRASNGGIFIVAWPDKKDPDNKSHCLGSSNNNFNGWLPNTGMESLIAKAAVASLYEYRQSIVDGYNKYYKE